MQVRQPGLSLAAVQEQILCLMRGGCSDRQILDILNLDEATFNLNVCALLAAFEVESREECLDIYFNALNAVDRSKRECDNSVRNQLILSESFFNSLQGLNDAYAVVNMDGCIVEFNEAFRSMVGYSDHELHSLKYTDLTPVHWHEYELEIINQQVLVSGYSEVFEKEYIHKNGAIFPVELRIGLIRNQENEPEAMWAIVRDISSRKAMQVALFENELKYRTLFESANDGIILVRGNRYIDCNSRLLEMFRCSRNDVIGKPLATLSTPLQPDGHASSRKARAFVKRAETGERLRFDWTCQRFDGTSFDAEICVHAINLAEEGFVQVLVRDNTERKRVLEALKQSESKFRQTFESLPVGACILDLGFRMKNCNRALCEFFGCRERDLVGQNFKDLPFTEFDDTELNRLDAVYQGSINTLSLTKKCVRKDKKVVWGQFSISVIRDGSGFPIYFIPIIIDITARHLAEVSLLDREAELNAVFEHSLDAISVSVNGIHKFVNPAYITLFGYDSLDQLVGTPLISIIAPESHDLIMETARKRYLRLPVPNRYEAVAQKKDGQTFPIEINATIFERKGETHTLAFLRDITDRKEKEKEQYEVQAELEKRVAERTAQLEQANHELESFSYSVSHDLRAPLRALDGFSKILREDHQEHLSEEGCFYLKRISDAATRMGRLVDDLLKLSRINRKEINVKKVDLEKLVKTSFENAKELEPHRNVELITQRAVVDGDPELLSSMITNLIDNAWKYTSRKRKARIEFGLMTSGEQTVYYIRDNGVGFDMAFSSHLFGAFQRLHSEAEFPGTGIGLATVQRIVHRHGGKIWAKAKPRSGATFYFTLGPLS